MLKSGVQWDSPLGEDSMLQRVRNELYRVLKVVKVKSPTNPVSESSDESTESEAEPDDVAEAEDEVAKPATDASDSQLREKMGLNDAVEVINGQEIADADELFEASNAEAAATKPAAVSKLDVAPDAASEMAPLDWYPSWLLAAELLSVPCEFIAPGKLVREAPFCGDSVPSTHAPAGNPASLSSSIKSRKDQREVRGAFRTAERESADSRSTSPYVFSAVGGTRPTPNASQQAQEAANHAHKLHLELEQKRRDTVWFTQTNAQVSRIQNIEMCKMWVDTFDRDDPEYLSARSKFRKLLEQTMSTSISDTVPQVQSEILAAAPRSAAEAAADSTLKTFGFGSVAASSSNSPALAAAPTPIRLTAAMAASSPRALSVPAISASLPKIALATASSVAVVPTASATTSTTTTSTTTATTGTSEKHNTGKRKINAPNRYQT